MTPPLIIYHSHCRDGYTAAWVAARSLGNADLHPAHYGDRPPDVTGRDVYVLDFSYSRADMLAMHAKARSLVVLDHHATAAENLHDLPFATFDMNESGASLAWRHFHGAWTPPKLVQYVRDRDLWRFELPDSHAVSAYTRTVSMNLAAWDQLADQIATDFDRVVDRGLAIVAADEQTIAAQARNPRMVEIGGVLFPAVNATTLIDEVGERLAMRGGVGAVWRVKSDGSVAWSLRSREGGQDVSMIAQQFGGGGHRAAAGFSVSLDQHLTLLGVRA